MKRYLILLGLILTFPVVKTKITQKRSDRQQDVAFSFLGKPYAGATLEKGTNDEILIINTDSVDCTTFVEYVVASRISRRKPDANDSIYRSSVERIRYRDGKNKGYPTRLHYFSEWILDNEKKGVLKEVTDLFQSEPAPQPINFMTTHTESYRQLKEHPDYVDSIRLTEEYLSALPLRYIPKEKLASQTSSIREGDIIAIVTTVKGLDISHVGFATWQNDQLHLLHASQTQKKVIVDPLPLTDYLMKNKSQKGIRVIRIR